MDYEELKKKIEKMLFPVEFLDHIKFTCGSRDENRYIFTITFPWDKVQPIVEKKEKRLCEKSCRT